MAMRIFWTGLAAIGAILAGLWMHGAVEALVEGAKLLLARALIWGTIAAAFAVWFARRPLIGALSRFAARVERGRDSHVVRRPDASPAERVLVGLFLTLCSFLTGLALFAPDAFVHAFREDGPFETGSAILYGLAAISCLLLAAKARGHRSLQLSLAFLAGLFVVVGGEEISWGQRIFGFGTPEGLAAVNVQEEFTLHNIYSISLFTYPALAVTATLLFAAPLLRSLNAPARRIFDALELPVAPLSCALLYAVGIVAYVIVGLRLGTPTPLPISWSDYVPHFDDEMLEFLISALFAVFALTNWRLRAPDKRLPSEAMPAGSAS